MQTALKEEAVSLISQMSESKIRTVIQFIHFIDKEPNLSLSQQERNERDLQIINANAKQFNNNAEENLEFQADIWNEE